MDNPDLTLAFYRYLCEVVGTENVVNMRRHLYTTLDNVYSSKGMTLISSGSLAEGIDLFGSDFDLMGILNYLPVYENKNTLPRIPIMISPFVMDTSECKPGFTQLKQLKLGYFVSECEYKAGEMYLSSTHFREQPQSATGSITHGPCISSPDGRVDFARSLRCKSWISQAKPWLLRSRYLWAGDHTIDNIIEFGIIFVPVGCKHSPNLDLEWRISFSYAEKLLIWSFNHVQLLCYALLKIVLKDIIKQTTGDLLCSYFLKTVMLWVCEETKSSQWKADAILSCFMRCFDRLIYCVKYKTCVHYFIPENDLFAERFDRQQHSLLLSTLDQLRMLGWTCLLQTQTLCSFRKFLEPVALPLIHFPYNMSRIWLCTFLAARDNFRQLKQSVYFCMRANKKDFYIYMTSMINGCISQTIPIGDKRLSGNKQSYSMYRKRLCHLLIGVNNDAVSGWLLLASHFYVNKQYKICTELLTDCLMKCTPDKTLLTITPSRDKTTRYSYCPRELRTMPLLSIRHHIINHIQFTPSSQIVPREIGVINRGNYIFISPVLLGTFLKFMCNHHLRNQKEKGRSLLELEFVVTNLYHIVNDHNFDIAHVLLSKAYSIMRDY